MRSKLTPSGARRRGDEYQDFIGLEVLVDWLGHSDRYQWVKFEADGAGYLDDVVALKADGTLILKQVKYSNHPDDSNDPLTWDDLLLRKSNSPTSLLEKWSTSLFDLLDTGYTVQAAVVSNRRAGDDLRANFRSGAGFVTYEDLSQDLQKRIAEQIPDTDRAKLFFANFEFQLNYPNYDELEVGIKERFTRVGGEPLGWRELQDEVRRWVAFRNEPRAGGEIYLEDIRRAALWNILKSLPQEFEIPSDYVLPSEEFHQSIVDRVHDDQESVIVITANPGVGKSTYCSFLYQDLRENDYPVIRHHYFLSTFDTSLFRLDHQRAAESLLHDLLRDFRVALGTLGDKNPHAGELREYIEACGEFYSTKAQKMVIIIDGLDHVWRERGSIDELRRLLEDLLPAPAGVVIILATQPITEDRLPSILLREKPQNEWTELDTLDPAAVDEWLQFHSETIFGEPADTVHHQTLRDMSDAFFQKSNGHPLYLKYALKSLIIHGRRITDMDVLALPGCPSKDITDYYRELWRSLDDDSRVVLTMLATCQFSWPESGILRCLMLQNTSSADANRAIKSVKHLMREDSLGLQAFHSSLLVFIQNLDEYKRLAPIQVETVLTWLAMPEAPEYLVWGYSWLLESQRGNYQPLMDGIRREWAVTAFAKRRSRDNLRQIFTAGLQVTLDHRMLARSFEQVLLFDRCFLYNNMDFEREAFEIVLYPQLLTSDDKYLQERLLSELRTLNNGEIATLAESLARENRIEDINRCLREIHDRLSRPLEYTSYSSWKEIVFPFLKVSALPDSANPYKTLQTAALNRENGYTYEMLSAYSQSLWVYGNTEYLRLVAGVTTEQLEGEELLETEVQILQKSLVLHSVEKNLNIDDLIPKAGTVAPHTIIYNKLQCKQGNEFLNVDLPNLDIYARGRFEHREASEPTWTLFYDSFFGFMAKHIQRKNAEIISWLHGAGTSRWHHQFLGHLNEIAREIVEQLDNGSPFSLAWFYEQLNPIQRPNLSPNDDDFYYIQAANEAVTRIGLDLLVLCKQPITEKDLRTLKLSPYCYFSNWLRALSDCRRAWLTPDAVTWLFEEHVSYLNKQLEYFPERAEQYAVLASIFVTHADFDKARQLLYKTADNSVAYGEHKDLLLNEVLDSIVVYHRHAEHEPETRKWLLDIAPTIAYVGEYTDGDETRHLVGELSSALSEIAPDLLPAYYHWLTDQEDYYNAENAFQTWLKNTSLATPLSRKVASTGVDAASLKILQDRAATGDIHAQKILEDTFAYYGDNKESDSDEDATSPSTEVSGGNEEPPDPNEYEPNKLSQYLKELQNRRIYSQEAPLKNWINHWVSLGKGHDVYKTIEAYVKDGGVIREVYDHVFDLALSLYGKEKAYAWLVEAQREQMGWHHYWTQKERTYRRWDIIATHYADRWENFLYDTITRDRPGSYTWYFDHFSFVRIIEYCLFMGNQELAKTLVETIVYAALEYISPIELEVPEWLPQR